MLFNQPVAKIKNASARFSVIDSLGESACWRSACRARRAVKWK